MDFRHVLLSVLFLFIIGCGSEEPLECYEIVIVGDYPPESMENMEDAKHIVLGFLEEEGVPSEYGRLFGIKEDTGGYTIQFKGEPPEIIYEGNPLHLMEVQLNMGKIYAKRKRFC